MELHSVFVTGANRGIGLEFVRQLSQLPKSPRFVFATYRSKDSLGPLDEIKNASKECQIVLIQMDVNAWEDIVAARKIVEQAVGDKGLTLLINNAGVCKPGPFPNITDETMLYQFTSNTIGPVKVLQELYPLLQKAASREAVSGGLRVNRAAVLNISSLAGSITKTGKEFLSNLTCPSYKMSKAALNMVMRVISANVKDEGILVVMMCPGWVKTDLGSQRADITPEESISTMLKTLEKLDESHQGLFMDRFGNPYDF